MRNLIVGVVVALLAIVGAFVGGMAATDPKTSDEYKSLAEELDVVKADLEVTEQQLDSSTAEVADIEQELSDAEAQVDALVSEAQAGGDEQGEPAVSDGAAIAPRNIKLAVRVRSKACFGSAGCNVTVQIDPSYVGNQDVSSGSWEMTYELRGGEDGPVIDQLTLEDGTFTFPEEQSLSTTSESAVITAVVTEVYSLN